MRARTAAPMARAFSNEPVAGTVWFGFGAEVALPEAVTVIVCVQFSFGALMPLALSERIADAWYVPGLL